MSGLSFVNRMRLEWAILQVDFELDGRVPRRRRKQIRDELRANLLEAAGDVGARQAVNQLGDLHTLASSYLNLYRGRFDFQAGAWAAVITFALLQVLGVTINIAFATGVIAGGGHSATYALWSGFGPFAGSVLNSGHGFSLAILSPAHLVLMTAAFAVASSYRLIRRRS